MEYQRIIKNPGAAAISQKSAEFSKILKFLSLNLGQLQILKFWIKFLLVVRFLLGCGLTLKYSLVLLTLSRVGHAEVLDAKLSKAVERIGWSSD